MKALTATLLTGLLAACATSLVQPGDTDAKRDVIRFIERQLTREDGEGWERSGQYFAWQHQFSRDGCTLHVTRRDLHSIRILRESIPMDRVRPGWGGQSSLLFACAYDRACIDYQHSGANLRDEGTRRQTRLLVPDPHDLPKLQDAFTELQRLCDDPYRLPPQGASLPRGQDLPVNRFTR